MMLLLTCPPWSKDTATQASHGMQISLLQQLRFLQSMWNWQETFFSFKVSLPQHLIAHPLWLHGNFPLCSPHSWITYMFSRHFPRRHSGSHSPCPPSALHFQPSITIVYLYVLFTIVQQGLWARGMCLFCSALCPRAKHCAWNLS